MLDSTKVKSTLSAISKRLDELSTRLDALSEDHKAQCLSNITMHEAMLRSIDQRFLAFIRSNYFLARQLSASIEHRDLTPDDKFEQQIMLALLEDDIARAEFDRRRIQLLLQSLQLPRENN